MSIEVACFGHLGRDAESKISKKGKPFVRLNIVVSEGDATQWISVTAFDPTAIENGDKFVRGARVYVEGRLSLDEWTGQDGSKRTGLSVLSWHCRLAQIGRNKPRRRQVSVAGGTIGEAPAHANGAAELDDEIPF